MSVWCVWTESGCYEDFSRNLRGIFGTRELAEAHAAQLTGYDAIEVVEDTVLTAIPTQVSWIEYAAHIFPDGREDKGPGYKRGSRFSTWSNELKPLDEARTAPWSRPTDPDLYIDVIGSDEHLVAAEYQRRLQDVRATLAKGESRKSLANEH